MFQQIDFQTCQGPIQLLPVSKELFQHGTGVSFWMKTQRSCSMEKVVKTLSNFELKNSLYSVSTYIVRHPIQGHIDLV